MACSLGFSTPGEGRTIDSRSPVGATSDFLFPHRSAAASTRLWKYFSCSPGRGLSSIGGYSGKSAAAFRLDALGVQGDRLTPIQLVQALPDLPPKIFDILVVVGILKVIPDLGKHLPRFSELPEFLGFRLRFVQHGQKLGNVMTTHFQEPCRFRTQQHSLIILVDQLLQPLLLGRRQAV